jgi:putative inorganic carbon (HCO3(-)) transporter
VLSAHARDSDSPTVTKAVVASHPRGALVSPRSPAEAQGAWTTSPNQRPPLALNLLCLWFVALLFFNEKTNLTFPLLFKIRPERLLFAWLLLHVILSNRAKYLENRKRATVEVLMVCFFGFLFVSCLLSGATPLYYHLSTVFSFIGFPMFTFWLCRRLPVTKSNVTRLVHVMIAIGGYLGLCGVCEHYNWHLPIYPEYIFDPSVGIHFGRSRGPFVQAAAFGGVLCLIAMMTIWSIKFTKNVREKVAKAMLLGLMIASIYLCDTRAVWLDFGLSVLILAVIRNGTQRYAYTAVLLVLAVFVSGAFSKFSLYEQTLFTRRDEAAYSRVVLADASINMIKQRPLLGVGYGTFVVEVTDFIDPEFRDALRGEGNHNTIVGLLAEVGIIGTLPFVLMLLGFLLQGVRCWRLSRNQSQPARDFAVAAVAILLGLLLLAQFGDQRFYSLFNSLLFAIFGVVFAWTEDLQSSLYGQRKAAFQSDGTDKGRRLAARSLMPAAWRRAPS